MITLDNIRELVRKQDKELEDLIKKYFLQSQDINTMTDKKTEKEIEKDINELLEKGQIEEAKKIVENYRTNNRDSAITYSMEGIIYTAEGDFERAYNSFNKGLEIDNLNVDLLFNIAYVSLLLGRLDECKINCDKCLLYSRDEDLNNQVYSILDTLNQRNNENLYTFITISQENDEIYKLIQEKKHRIINIVENKDEEREYENNGVTIYEVNNVENTIESLTRNTRNCVLLMDNPIQSKFIKYINDDTKIVYYTNNNLYTDKKNYLNNNIDILNEKIICDASELILTNNISVYIFKSIIEKRNNILLISSESENSIDTFRIMKNNTTKLEDENIKVINKWVEKTESDYIKLMLKLAIEKNNINNCICLAKEIYETYKTEESYKIYISLLVENKEYSKLLTSMIDSLYCEEVYKLEITYLYNLQKYDLIDFIVYLSLKLYKNIDSLKSNHIDYIIGNYTFDINNFKEAYNRYILVLQKGDYLSNSPLINRNMSYLLYANKNTDYEKFYSIYINLLKVFREG